MLNGRNEGSTNFADAKTLFATEIERRFREWARQLVLDELWDRERLRIHDCEGAYGHKENMRASAILEVVRRFAGKYRALLEKSAIEYVELWMSKGLGGSDTDISSVAILCARRFICDEYAKPWQGFFVARPRPTDPRFDTQDLDPLAVRHDFQSVQTAWFENWFEARNESEKVSRCFSEEIRGWENGAAGEIKHKIALGALTGGAGSDKPAKHRSNEGPPAKGFSGLGAKKQDLSRYLDSPNLTTRQQDCLSLKLEYNLPVTEIARRLTLHRKTVQEHINAGERALKRDESLEHRAKRRASRTSSQDE